MANTRNCKLNRGDFISLLPDDILLNILSKLNIKEQVRTGVLSSRWINLWAFNSCLNIDAGDFVQREANSPTMSFINTADQILKMHRGQVIDQLKITCSDNLRVTWREHHKVYSWIDIVTQKQVKGLHLDLKLERSVLSLGSTTFSSLVTLYLKNTYLHDHIIHGLLSNSPNLLELSIINSKWFLRCLNISGSSLKLKHLELIDNWIINLELSAPNLVSFNISSVEDCRWPKRIRFKNIPLLTQLSCSFGFILHAWNDFYGLLPQLVTLTLTLSNIPPVRNIGNFPVLENLKQMHVRILSNNDGLLHLLLGLFRASPCLRRLSFNSGVYTLKHNFIETFSNLKFLGELEIT